MWSFLQRKPPKSCNWNHLSPNLVPSASFRYKRKAKNTSNTWLKSLQREGMLFQNKLRNTLAATLRMSAVIQLDFYTFSMKGPGYKQNKNKWAERNIISVSLFCTGSVAIQSKRWEDNCTGRYSRPLRNEYGEHLVNLCESNIPGTQVTFPIVN